LKSISDRSGGRKSNKKLYVLKCDVSKYFDSIDHQILFSLLRKKIADQKVLWLVKIILESSNKESGKGIPIGNLTSQLFANVYLNELDQFVKHQLRLKYYLRYMDDFLILDFEKKKLHQIKEKIREFLQNKLKLELHPKKANIFQIDKGIDFLGYQIFVSDPTGRRPGGGIYRLLRKSTVKRFIKRTETYQKMLNKGLLVEEKFNNSLQSWLAYAEHGNSWRLRKNLSEKLKVKLIK